MQLPSQKETALMKRILIVGKKYCLMEKQIANRTMLILMDRESKEYSYFVKDDCWSDSTLAIDLFRETDKPKDV